MPLCRIAFCLPENNKKLSYAKYGKETDMPILTEMTTWTDRLGHSHLRTFTDEENRFWIEQNASKDSRWAKLAREGHAIAWEFESPGGSYTGRVLIDGNVYSTPEAVKKFLAE